MATIEDIRKWTVKDVGSFLSDMDFSLDVVQRFEEEEVDGDALLLLDEPDLKDDLGLKLGPRKKLLQRLKSLKSPDSEEKVAVVGLQDENFISSPGQSGDGNLEMHQEYSNVTQIELGKEIDDESSEENPKRNTVLPQNRSKKVLDDLTDEHKVNQSTLELNVDLQVLSYQENFPEENIVVVEESDAEKQKSRTITTNYIFSTAQGDDFTTDTVQNVKQRYARNFNLPSTTAGDKREPVTPKSHHGDAISVDANYQERRMSSEPGIISIMPSISDEDKSNSSTISTSNDTISFIPGEHTQEHLEKKATREIAVSAYDGGNKWQELDTTESNNTLPLIPDDNGQKSVTCLATEITQGNVISGVSCRVKGQEKTVSISNSSNGLHGDDAVEPHQNIVLLPTERQENETNANVAGESASLSPRRCLTAQCVEFLQQINLPVAFTLIDQGPSHDCTECTISSIRPHNEENDLEKALTFIVVTKVKECLNSDKLRTLWNAICKKQITWLNVLPDVLQQRYYIQDNVIYAKNTCKPIPIRERKVAHIKLQNLSKRPIHGGFYGLIVEESLMSGGIKKCYFQIEERGCKHIEFELGSESRAHATFHLATLEKNGLTLTPYLLTLEKKNLLTLERKLSETKHNESKINVIHKPLDTMKEEPREFDTTVGLKTYINSYQLNCNESGASDLIEPAHEFKLFRCSGDTDNAILYFADQTLRFVCACLNSRTNGTIHFGIADGKETESAKFHHLCKEIVGVSVESQDIFREKQEEYIQKSFLEHSRVMQCVRPPQFIPVRDLHGEKQLFVIEVDVVSSSNFTERILFNVSLPKKKKTKTQPFPYFRVGSSSKRLEGEELSAKTQLLDSLDRQRKLAENEHQSTDRRSLSHKSLHTKLQELVCDGRSNKMNNGVYPVLVLTKPDSEMTVDECKNLDFIKSIDWSVVIDFDENALIRDTVFTTGEPFRYSKVFVENFEKDFNSKNLLGNPCWILGNGNKRDGKRSFEFREWYCSARNKNLSRVVQRLTAEFPKRRVLVIFLLLSKHYRDGNVLFAEFCKEFESPNRLLFIAENKDISSPWMHELSGYLTQKQMIDRSVIGMSWFEVNRSMQEFGGVAVQNDMLLPSPNGSSIDSRRGDFKAAVIYPLGIKECSELQNLSLESRKKLSSKEELRFYRGSKVTWNNLWFTDHEFNHVLKRNKMDEVVRKTKALLQKPAKEGRVFTLKLLHEAGAGASTLGKHAIWSFSQSEPYLCRCCVICQITDDTLDEILHLRRYKCDDHKLTEHLLPVLAFVDNMVDNQPFEDLFAQMASKAQELPNSQNPVVVFIQAKECVMAPEVDEDTTVFLRQQLERNEIQWFEHKFSKMSEAYGEQFQNFKKYATENLISFMIMKENFNPEYGLSVVRRSLKNANTEEEKLLKYLSLLCLHEAYQVDIAVFDSMMLSPEFQEKQYFPDWLFDLTPSTRVLLKEEDMPVRYGSGTEIAIVHPLIANAVVDAVTGTSSVSDIALEFLRSSQLWNDTSLPTKRLRAVASSMLTHRKKYEYKEESDSQSVFPLLIEKILYDSSPGRSTRSRHHSHQDRHANVEDIEKAERLLLCGLELFEEPRIAQQLARLFYLHATSFTEETDASATFPSNALEKCFSQSLKHARKAIEMRPNNVYFMDTVGRVYKKKLEVLFPSKRSQTLSIETVANAIQIALCGIEWFRKVQALSRNKRNVETLSGDFGELSMMTTLLDVFLCVLNFQGPDGQKRLSRYLENDEPFPKWEKFHKDLKQFTLRFQECISHIKEDWTVYKTNPTGEDKKLVTFCIRYHEFFSSGNVGICENPDFDFNSRQIDNYLIGEVFSSIFNIDQIPTKEKVTDARVCLLNIKERLEWNLQHCPDDAGKRSKTCLAMITVSMALHSPHSEQNYHPNKIRLAKEYKTVCDLLRKYAEITSRRRNWSLYPHFLKVMLLWPRDDTEMPNYEPDECQKAIITLGRKFSARSRSVVHDPDQDLHPKSTSRSKVRAATTLFYLGKGTHLDAFVHVNELVRMTSNKLVNNQVNWNHHHVRQRLRRLEGQSKDGTTIRLKNPRSPGKYLTVSCAQQPLLPKGDLKFYLGFSWTGPIAVDIKEAKYEDSTEEPFIPCAPGQYKKRVKNVDRKLKVLESLGTLDRQQKKEKSELKRQKIDLMDAFGTKYK